MRIAILTSGSRGDVQPYIALALGLQDAGYEVVVGADSHFSGLVDGYRVPFAPLRADYYRLIDSPEGRDLKSGNPIRVLRQMQTVVFPLIRQMLDDAWVVGQDADALIYHPKVLGGADIAEKLAIPAIAAVAAPIMTPTAAFPMPGVVHRDLGATLNKLTYLVTGLAQGSLNSVVGTWREQTLHLPRKSSSVKGLSLDGQPIPVLYPISPRVVPPPADYPPTAHMTGYWFLPQQASWQPSAELIRFLEDGDTPIYIGFGSMVSEDTAAFTRLIIDAVGRSGARAVLATGWGGIKASDLPASIFKLDEAPHDWLFPRMKAVVHHGGAGTVAAGLRAGKPTGIVPFLADQPFWGNRLHALGIAPKPIPQKALTVEHFADILTTLATDALMRQRAEAIGAQISAEDGVGEAVCLVKKYVGNPLPELMEEGQL
jgi:sterol 3beta-glucosyltransferase